MKTRKYKNISTPLFRINGFFLTNTLHIILDRTKNNDIVYVVSQFTYKNRRIHTSSNRYRCKSIQNEEYENIENKIKEAMEKNHSIKIKEISEQTGLSIYTIRNKFYMKIRREQYPKVLR